jgi:hypothetical protein
MSIKEKGFDVSYEVQKMGLIKVGGSGKMDNGFEYTASLKVRTSNLLSEYDDELGDVDKEELIEFKIPCESNVQAGELNRLFRDLKHHGVVIPFNGGLPRKYQNTEYSTVTVTDKVEDIFAKFKDMKKDTKTAKAN